MSADSGVPMGARTLQGRATPLPVTVTTRETRGSPRTAQRAMAAAVATFWQSTPASAGKRPEGTSIPVTAVIN